MAITGISTAIIDIRAVDHISGQLGGISARIAMLGRAISSAGLAMTATFSIPLAAGLIKASEAAIAFDRSLRNIQAIGKQSDAQIAALSQRMVGLSTDITKTIAPATDLAEAFYEIQSSGRYGAEAGEILTKSTKAATAGLATTKSTALAATGVLNAYGASAEDVSGILDVMVRGVDIGIFRLEELSAQMGDFIGVAGMLKVPFPELIAALTTMTKKKLPIDEAATSLNRIFTTFLKPSDAAIAAAKQFGIELNSTSFKAKGFAATMQDVYDKTGGSADALNQIFRDMRGARGVMFLASDGMKMFNSDLGVLANSAGSVDQIFSVQIKSWSAQVQNFKNNVQALGITIGNIILPVLARLLEAINRQITAFQHLPPSQQEFFLKLAAGIIALGPALLIIGQLISALSILSAILVSPIALIAILAGAAIGVSAAFMIWHNNTAGLADGLQGLANQANIFGAALQGIINAFRKLDQAGFMQQDFLARATGVGGLGVTVDIIEAFGETVKFVLFNVIELVQIVESTANAFKTLIDIMTIWGNAAGEIIRNTIIAMEQLIRLIVGAGSALGRLGRGEYFGAVVEAGNVLEAYNKWQEASRASSAAWEDAGKRASDVIAQYLTLQNEINLQHAFEKQQLQLSDVTGPLRTLMSYLDFIKANPRAALGGMDMILGTAADIAAGPLMQLPPELVISAGELENAGVIAGDAIGAAAGAMNQLASRFDEILNKGRDFSKQLGDLINAPGGGGLAPGANGPFENLYRLQDIAMHLDKPGADTAKWVELLSKINPMAANQQWATSTVRDFQMGNFTPNVQQFIDMDKLVEYAQSIDQASASQERLAQQLAGQAGVSISSARTAVGALAPSGTAAATVAAQSIEVQTANRMLDAMTAAITARTGLINTAGVNFMTALIDGMADNKQTFIDLFVSMIKDAAKLLIPPTPPGGSSGTTTNGGAAGTGTGVRAPQSPRRSGSQEEQGYGRTNFGTSGVNFNVSIRSLGDPRSIAHGTEIGLRRAARAIGL